MSKILTPGTYAIIAKADTPLSETSFTAENCALIYETNSVYKHWQPDGELNAFDTLVKGVGYIAIIKQTVDVSEDFADADDIASPIPPKIAVINKSGQSASIQFLNTSSNPIAGEDLIIADGAGFAVEETEYPAGTVNIAIHTATPVRFCAVRDDGVGGQPNFLIPVYTSTDIATGMGVPSHPGAVYTFTLLPA